MKTEKEIREVYEKEKKFLDMAVKAGCGDNDYYIQQGWVEALGYVLKEVAK
jgi:hypothetical protein